MSTVLLSTHPGHAPVLMGAFPEQIVNSSIFSLIPLTLTGQVPEELLPRAADERALVIDANLTRPRFVLLH